jgi:hypothetical protein
MIMAHKLAQGRSTHPHINSMNELRNNAALFNYLRKAMFIPTKAALIKSVKQGHLTIWPGLTEDAITSI